MSNRWPVASVWRGYCRTAAARLTAVRLKKQEGFVELSHPTEREEEILSEVKNVRRHIPVGQQGTFQEQNTLYKSDHLLPLLKIVPVDTSLYCGTVWRSLFLKIKPWDYVNEQNIEFFL